MTWPKSEPTGPTYPDAMEPPHPPSPQPEPSAPKEPQKSLQERLEAVEKKLAEDKTHDRRHKMGALTVSIAALVVAVAGAIISYGNVKLKADELGVCLAVQMNTGM